MRCTASPDGAGPDVPPAAPDAMAFLVACVAGDVARARAGFASGVNLEDAAALAIQHEVIGEWAAAIAAADLPLPADIVSAIDVFTQRQAEFQCVLRRHTIALSRLFEAADVDVLFAKGAVWDALFRPPEAIRSGKDIDVYLRRNDVPAALRALRDGYEAVDRLPLKVTGRHLHHHSVWLTEPEVTVELHWAVAAPWHGLRFDLAAALASPAPATVDGWRLMTLAPADAVVFSALELSKDSWASLKKILDFAAAVRAADDSAIRAAVKRAAREGSARALAISLHVATELGLLEPTTAMRWPARAEVGIETVARICRRRLFDPVAAPAIWRRATEGIAMAAKHDTVGARLHHLWRIILVYRLRRWFGLPPWQR